MAKSIRVAWRRGSQGCRFYPRAMLFAAIVGVGWPTAVRANGTFDGDQVSLAQARQWSAPLPNPGLNWDFDTLPTALQNLVFSTNGDGSVDLQLGTPAHPALNFGNWVSYTLLNGTLSLSGATLTVGDAVHGTYGSSYFADGNQITADLSIATPLGITFAGMDDGALRLGGSLFGVAPLSLSTAPGTSNNRGVYFDQPSPSYSGMINIGSQTSVRLVAGGRPGVGAVNLRGGELHVLSDNPAGEMVLNPLNSADGIVRADHNYLAAVMPAYLPGITHTLGSTVVDNPTGLGGTSAATITFEADNGYNHLLTMLTLANGALAPGLPSRNVVVNNGQRYAGYVGSTRLTGPNRLEEQVVTTTVGMPGMVGPALFDFDPVTGAGFALNKYGTGVLEINGDNQTSSTGPKVVNDGVLRFNSPISYGTANGLIGGPPVPVMLAGAAAGAPVSAGMGVGYFTAPPANLFTTGVTPGQSGAFDVDIMGNPLVVPLTIINTAGGATSLRIGSSGMGLQTGPLVAYTDPNGNNFYYLGGGGGMLDIASPITPGIGPGTNWVEMGTTGTLLPGRVNLLAPVGAFPMGGTLIRAGTLGAFPPGILAGMPMTSLGAYSTGIDSGCNYVGAPAASPYNGPGMLLLDAMVQNTGGYSYAPGGGFGMSGLLLDGGAVGWNGPVNVPILPGVYGVPLTSNLYQSTVLPAAPINTNILHLGGEDSAGVMTVGFPIMDNLATPVALIKSGVNSVLDLTTVGIHPYSGGTGIMGGTIQFNSSAQLGKGAIVIADGGALAVAPGTPPGTVVFTQTFRVANGIQRRSGVVDTATPGNIVQFTGAASPGLLALEADVIGSVLEVTGGGRVELYSTAMTAPAAATTANTWGVKATNGTTVSINHLPGAMTARNGQAIFCGGTIDMVDPLLLPFGIPIPAAIQYNANYGFGAMSSYAGTTSTLNLQPNAFFRVTGGQRGEWMGTVNVTMGPNAVLKLASDPTGESTRGTGTMILNGGNVQFWPSGPNRILPSDGAFTLGLNNNVLFSGGPGVMGMLNGNLLLNNLPGSSVAMIDSAAVNNAPASTATTWNIAGTGETNWNALVVKTQTQAVPGGPGPFTNGTVAFNRSMGAPVIVQPGATLRIDFGMITAGGTGDPFMDNCGATTLGNRVDIENNSAGSGAGTPPLLGFNVLSGTKSVGSLTVTGFNPAAPALGGSAAAVMSGGSLSAYHVRQARLDVNGGGSVVIPANGSTARTSRVNSLNIAVGGAVDLNDNDLLIDYTGVTPIGSVRAYLFAGQLFSTTANSSTSPKFAIGYRENSTGLASFSGQAIDSTTLLVAYTLSGDANVDGNVNTVDFNNLAGAFGLAGQFWINGDFNYDGLVNSIDFTSLAANYGSTTTVGAGPVLGATVPEPSLLLWGAATLPLLLRVRRFG